MPRHPSPWYRDGRGWYVQLGGRQHFLGVHVGPTPEKNKAGKAKPPAEIQEAFHRLMATPKSSSLTSRVVPADGLLVFDVLEAFMLWFAARVAEGSKAARTYEKYKSYLNDFLVFEGTNYRVKDLLVAELDAHHVYQWVDSHPDWRTGKHTAISSLQRAMNWGAKTAFHKAMGGVSPIAAVEKPPKGRRERLVTEREYLEVLALVRDNEFRALLELSWETGCRPQELFSVAADYVDLQTGRWVFPIRESKGKKIQRVVHLSDRALAITRRLVMTGRQGPMLRNTDGRPWCKSAVKCRFQRICRELGRRRLRQSGEMPPKLPRLTKRQLADPATVQRHAEQVKARYQLVRELSRKHGTRLFLYAFRHTFITESLVKGNDSVTTALLAGLESTMMISRHYSHLEQKHEHMRAAANRARPG